MTFVSNHNFEKSFKALEYHQKKKVDKEEKRLFSMVTLHDDDQYTQCDSRQQAGLI